MAAIVPNTGLVRVNGSPITRTDVRQARAQASGGYANPYDAASSDGQWFGGWRPTLQSPDREWLPNRDPATARVRDQVRNDPIGGAAIARRKNSAIGGGWRLSSKPNWRRLGITPKAARDLGALIESEWKMYAYGHAFEIDGQRRLNFGGLLRLAASHDMMDGEGFGLSEWAADEPTRYKTRLRLVDPDRVSNPSGRSNDRYLRNGIEHNAAMIPVRYWIREGHPADFGTTAMNWRAYDRFTAWGRPQVMHWLEPDRAEQSRGVSRFVSSLRAFRAFSRFTDATLQSATINALIIGFIKSSAGAEAVTEHFRYEDLAAHEKDREKFYDENPVKMGEAIMPVFPLGDEPTLATATKDVTGFDEFTRAIIRLIASSLGVTYEELSMDYSQTNYSSARAALIHAQAETESMQARLQSMLVKPFFVAWLEEAFDRGYITAPEGAPDFYDAIDAYAEAKWIGPRRGYIDPTKEIIAAAARIEAGVSTLEDECADQGKDYVEVLEQQAYERQLRIDLNLPDPNVDPYAPVADPTMPEGQVAPEDARPGQGNALAACAVIAASSEHAAFLDARPA